MQQPIIRPPKIISTIHFTHLTLSLHSLTQHIPSRRKLKPTQTVHNTLNDKKDTPKARNLDPFPR